MQRMDRRQKNVFGHISVKNDHVVVIEGILEAYWEGASDEKKYF